MKKKGSFSNKTGGFLLLAFLVFGAQTLFAQTQKNRVIEKVFEGKTALWAGHRYGNIVLKKGAGTQIKAVLTISASSKNEAELEQFLNHFELNASEAPDNKVDIKTAEIINCWNTVNGRSTISFRDGQSFSGIHKFDMTLEIYVPKLRYATLENKYAGVKAEEGTAGNLEIILFDGAVDAPGNFENLTIDIKYSKGVIGNFNNCNAQFYDSDVSLGNGGALTVASKYSGLNIGKQQSLQLECFDDNYKIGGVSGATKIADKYSEFTFLGNIGEADFSLYDSKVEGKNGGNVAVDSKYSKIGFQELNSLQFRSAFDDAVMLQKVGVLAAVDSKYTEYKIAGLWKGIHFTASYDDDIKVETVGSTFDALMFDGKYTDLTLPIPPSLKYEMDASIKYGKLIYPSSNMESSNYKEKNEETAFQAKTKGASAGAPKFVVKSYDGVIRLE